jgi:hypothetical protein
MGAKHSAGGRTPLVPQHFAPNEKRAQASSGYSVAPNSRSSHSGQ